MKTQRIEFSWLRQVEYQRRQKIREGETMLRGRARQRGRGRDRDKHSVSGDLQIAPLGLWLKPDLCAHEKSLSKVRERTTRKQ